LHCFVTELINHSRAGLANPRLFARFHVALNVNTVFIRVAKFCTNCSP